MDIDTYKKAVMVLLGGALNPRQLHQISDAVLWYSENYPESIESVDEVILGPLVTCNACGHQRREKDDCSCGQPSPISQP